jgi:putative peptidoglycan lipid II flippase
VLVARVQQMIVLQVPVFITGMFLVRVISALGRNEFLLFITLGSVVLNALLDYVLMRVLGVAGIALATSIVYVLATSSAGVIVYVLLRAQRHAPPR